MVVAILVLLLAQQYDHDQVTFPLQLSVLWCKMEAEADPSPWFKRLNPLL